MLLGTEQFFIDVGVRLNLNAAAVFVFHLEPFDFHMIEISLYHIHKFLAY